MSLIQVSPRYSGDRGPSSNRPCSPQMANELLTAGKAFARSQDPSSSVEVVIIEKPRWHPMKDHWWSIPVPRFATRTSEGHLFLIWSRIRTFGVSSTGELYIGRTYPEIHGQVFLSLHPLLQTEMDIGVLEYELLPLLSG